MTSIRPVLFLDIDRTLLPIRNTSAWPDYTTIESPYGFVPMSPRLLSAIGGLPAHIVYVTDWGADAKMFDQHLGRDDTEVAARAVGDSWWKTQAIADYLHAHPEVDAFIHADDHLTTDRIRTLRRIAGERDHLTVVPKDGFTPEHVTRIRNFLAGH